MTSKLKRLTLAAILSGSGFAVTFLWYKSTDRSNLKSDEPPLAQVGSVSDEVLRRPPTRLLWHSVNTGDSLFNGEAIRTSQAGEARIQFEDGRYIDIEPDSLIVLSKAQGEISLDLMEGSLFVNAKSDSTKVETQSSGLVLNSADGKVDLSGSSASLSKSEGQKLNLQVVEGRAKIQSKDGKTKEITSGKSGVLGMSGLQFDSNSVKIFSPLPNKSVYVDPQKKPEVQFSWAGFPKDWNVALLIGTQRRGLKEAAALSPGSEKASTTLALGRHYWKVVARDPISGEVKAESPIHRFDVVARSTPALLSPAPNAVLDFESLPGSVLFQWQKPEESGQLLIEVALDPQLVRKVATKKVNGANEFTLPNVAEGQYYWRLSTYYLDTKETWSGPIQQFKVAKKAEDLPVTVDISWLHVDSKQYYVDQPVMHLTWTAGMLTQNVSKWKVVWKDATNPSSEPQSLETKEAQVQTKVQKPGRFIASVEAFDDKGRPIGKSKDVQFSIEPKPVLPAPQFLPEEGQLTSQSNGQSEISWKSVQGAKEYQISVFSKNGQELFKKKFTSLKTTLTNLMPGVYTLNVWTIDEHGRPSAQPTSRSLLVPDKSHLRAPAVKKVKVN